MIVEIRIPSPGESITEVELASWLVEDGDQVGKDQEIGEIESDKATLPLISQANGKIKIKVEEGQTVKVGDVVGEVDTDAKGKKTDKTQVNETKKEQQQPMKEEKDKENEQAKVVSSVNETSKTQPTAGNKHEKVKVSPLASKLMEENDLNVEDIINGLKRISTKEVNAVLKNGAETMLSFKTKEVSREIKRQPMSSLRKKLSQRLVAVKNDTAMLTTFNEVNMKNVIELRKKYQKAFIEKHDIKLGYMSFFTKAVVEALKQFPKVNSQINGNDIVTPEYYDIGIAVQTDKGLMVPIVRNAETLGLAQIEKQIADLAKKARSFRLSIEEMSGGTFTITNGGIFGSLLSTPIINPPQSAILGMHNIAERPVAVNGKVEIHPMMYVALSYDHRIIDGKDSVSFLVKIKELIELPQKMLFGDKDPDKILLDL